MSPENDNEKAVPALPAAPSLPTQGVPSLYANHASISMSFNDIRAYLSEAQPESVVLVPQPQKSMTSNFKLLLCLVMTPEFAKQLGEAIMSSVSKYEAAFGPLRPNPDHTAQPSITEDKET